jgi:hypothetical protein
VRREPATRGSALAQHQDPCDAGGAPSPVASDRRSKARLSIERKEHGLDVRNDGADRFADRAKLGERHSADTPELDPALGALRDSRLSRDVALAEVLPTTERADHPAESDSVHARTMDGRP